MHGPRHAKWGERNHSEKRHVAHQKSPQRRVEPGQTLPQLEKGTLKQKDEGHAQDAVHDQPPSLHERRTRQTAPRPAAGHAEPIHPKARDDERVKKINPVPRHSGQQDAENGQPADVAKKQPPPPLAVSLHRLKRGRREESQRNHDRRLRTQTKTDRNRFTRREGDRR